MKPIHLRVVRITHSEFALSGRACGGNLNLSDKPNMTTYLPLMVTCKRCVLTRAYKRAVVPA